MRYLRLLGVAIVALASTGTVALASSRIGVMPGLGYKPHEITISGDGDFWVQGLRWKSWGGKSAVAVGQAVEQERPSHVNHTYPTRVTVSHRAYCANLHRTVYRKIVAQILGPDPGVFGRRSLGVVWSCTTLLRLTASDAGAPSSATAPDPAADRATAPANAPAADRATATGHATATATDRATAAAAAACPTSGLHPPGVTRSLTARGTSCASARRVVGLWFQKLKQPHTTCVVPDGSYAPAVCTVRVWRCTSTHTVNGATYPVTCRSHAGRREVHFVNGV